MAMPHKFTSETIPAKRSGAVATEWVVGGLGSARRRYRRCKERLIAFPGRSNATRQRAIRQIFALGFAGLLVGSSPGCTILSNVGSVFSASDACDEFMIGHRNSAMAAKAWYREKAKYQNHPYRDSFRDGFIAGYIDVAEGGAGCAPSVAPPEYWGWQYQSPNGQRATDAWFEGFPHGAQSAEQDGVGHWGHIQTVGLQQSSESQPSGSQDAAAAGSPHASDRPHPSGRPQATEELPVPSDSAPFDRSSLPEKTSGELLPAELPADVGPIDDEPERSIGGGLGSFPADGIGGEQAPSPQDGGDDAGLSFRFE